MEGEMPLLIGWSVLRLPRPNVARSRQATFGPTRPITAGMNDTKPDPAIFTTHARSTGLRPVPENKSPATTDSVRRPPLLHVNPALDARLVAILEEPPQAGEPFVVAFARKEQQLGAVFATLEIIEARALHARLAAVRP